MKKIFSIFFILLCQLVLSAPFAKSLIFTENNQWVPLGRFTKTGDPNVHVRMASKPWVTAEKKLIIYIVAYTPNNWQSAIKGRDCTSFLEHMNNQYTLNMPMDTSWSDLQKLDFIDPNMYFVASICYSPYNSELQGYSVILEMDGVEQHPISDADLAILKGDDHTAPVIIPHEVVEIEQNSRFTFFNTAALIFFILSVIVSRIVVKEIFTKAFLFQFPIVIACVIMRILMHITIIFDYYSSSEIIDTIIILLDVFSQYAFIFTSIINILGDLFESVLQSILVLVILSLLYFIIGYTSSIVIVLIVRGITMASLGIALGIGLRKQDQPKSVKYISFATGMVYILALIIVDMDIMGCVEKASALIDRFYLLKGYQKCVSDLHWFVEADYLIQAISMSAALFVLGYFIKDK